MLQFATHEIGRFHEVFKQFGQLFWESGGFFRISEDSLSHKITILPKLTNMLKVF
jgi:hypothetical protein